MTRTSKVNMAKSCDLNENPLLIAITPPSMNVFMYKHIFIQHFTHLKCEWLERKTGIEIAIEKADVYNQRAKTIEVERKR